MADISFTSDNWGFPPFNRQSFQQVQLLFPTTRIHRGAGPMTEFDFETRDLEDIYDIAYSGPDGSNRTVGQMLDDSFTDSFLVAKKGVILCEQYYSFF